MCTKYVVRMHTLNTARRTVQAIVVHKIPSPYFHSTVFFVFQKLCKKNPKNAKCIHSDILDLVGSPLKIAWEDRIKSEFLFGRLLSRSYSSLAMKADWTLALVMCDVAIKKKRKEKDARQYTQGGPAY